jgi:flagella basal body P-ring formation protein FlgA
MKRMIVSSFIFLALVISVKAHANISLKTHSGPFCSAIVSWAELLESENPISSIVKCMDENAPVITTNLNKNKLVSQLKTLKTKCNYRGGLQIPEKFEIKLGDRLDEDFIEKSIAVTEQFHEQKIDIKMVRMLPMQLSCGQIKKALISNIKLESKNFFRWSIETDAAPIVLTGEFKVLKDVPVTKTNLSMGDRLSSADWMIEKRDVTFQNDVLSQAEEFEGRSLARGLTAGSMIRLQDLKREFLVEKNQMVKVKMGGTEFEITSMAIAESSGYQGDWIKLKNPDTQKSFTGVAIAKGLVEVR